MGFKNAFVMVKMESSGGLCWVVQRKHEVMSARSLEYDAIAEILLFGDSDKDMIPLESS